MKQNSILLITLGLIVIGVVASLFFIFKNAQSPNQPNPNNMSDLSIELSIANAYDAPEIRDVESWINSDGETLANLKGKVVLIDFWTYSCINCIRTIPFVNQWYETYKDDGFVVIGMHAPEFSFEKVQSNVEKAVQDYGIMYPVGLDNNFSTWRAYDNRFWPAHYFIDKEGKVRHTHFGEGEYDESEMVIRYLLGLDDHTQVSNQSVVPPIRQGQTLETYLGYSRIKNVTDIDNLEPDVEKSYVTSVNIPSNYWSVGGAWTIQSEQSIAGDGATMSLRFNAKDVYLVMGADAAAIVTVKVNGQLQNLGEDVNEQGEVMVNEDRLYKIVHSDEFLQDAVLELTFEKGVAVNAFTFGG